MIIYNKETNFILNKEEDISNWLAGCILNETKNEGVLNYIFCNDNYLRDINVKYLKHNTLTDIITFDYTIDQLISGDIFISIDRVKENSKLFDVLFDDELHRVMVHGVLHLCGYEDETEDDKKVMRSKEDYYLSLRTFKNV